MSDQPDNKQLHSTLTQWAQDIIDTAKKHDLLPMDGLYVYALNGPMAIEINAHFTEDDHGNSVAMTEVRAGESEAILSRTEEA